MKLASLLRDEEGPGAAAASVLPAGSAGPVAWTFREPLLADAHPEPVVSGEAGAPAADPVRTPAARWSENIYSPSEQCCSNAVWLVLEHFLHCRCGFFAGRLVWNELWEGELSCSALSDLAGAVLLLYAGVRRKEEIESGQAVSILTILEELFCSSPVLVLQYVRVHIRVTGDDDPPPSVSFCAAIPYPWHVENKARLLVLCGRRVCYTFMASKAINGHLEELSRLIVHIILVRIRGHVGRYVVCLEFA